MEASSVQRFTAELEDSDARRDLPTLVHRCRWHGETDHSSQTAFTMVLDQDWNEDRLSYGDLDRRSRAIGGHIQSKTSPGDRVLIVLDPGLDYVASLFGCMYAGVIAVPVYPPSMLRLQHTLSRLQAIIKDADATLMLSSREVIGEKLSPLWCLDHEQAIAVDELDVSSADDWQIRMPSPDDSAILQYTSGSTGIPRGVVLSHANLMHNLSAMIRHFHFPGAKAVIWLPPYHDMGLIGGILLPAYQGVETVLMTPKDFVSSPIRWLQAFDRYKGTSTGSPNFGYELCIRKVKPEDCEGLDLSSWKVAVTGAEPVRASTVRRFTEKFAPYGFDPKTFCPSMGMAESTVIITGSPLGDAPITYEVDCRELAAGNIEVVAEAGSSTQTLVSSGETVADMQVEIVDPQTCKLTAPGKVGEIWVRGPSVASGYWNQPEKTATTFNGTIAGSGESCYLRTGDLGCLIGDQLIVTGRIKELIILGGRNFYPHDIETTVQACSEAFKADSGTAFSIEIDQQEQLVVLQEVWRPKKFDIDQLLDESLDALVESTGTAPHAIVLVKSGSLPKTSSGKLRRTDCREMYLAGELAELASWHADGTASTQIEREFVEPTTKTEREVASIWEQLLSVEKVGLNDDFFLLGGQSMLVSQLIATIAERYGVRLEYSVLFGNSTLAKMCAKIDEAEESVCRTIESVSRDRSSHPLSASQERFWLLHELEQDDAFLHVPVSLRLKGTVDVEQLTRLLNTVCQKHEALRTVFAIENGTPVQRVLASVEVQVESHEIAISELPKFTQSFASRPFDLQAGPLLRTALIQTGNEQYRFMLVMHHIASDAGSVEVLLRDLANESTISPRLQYVDYANWDQSTDRKKNVASELEYWRQRLGGAPERLRLPSGSDNKIAPIHRRLDSQLSAGITELARDQGTIPSMIYLAVYQHALARYTGSIDLPIAVPTTDRPSPSLAGTVGCFINPIVFRGEIDGNGTFVDLLRATHSRMLDDLQHSGVPFQDVVAAIGHERSLQYMPLAQNMFLYQQAVSQIEHLAGASVEAVDPDYASVTAYDLSVAIHPGDETTLVFVHNENFDHRAAENFADLVVQSLQAIVVNPNCSIANLPGMSQSDLDTVTDWNRLDTTSETNDSVIEKLTQFAGSQPDAIAVTDDARSITFAELESQATAFAIALKRQGVERESLIGIHLPRSIDMIIAMLGVWKAGGAYVPLDASFPGERLRSMVENAGLHAIIAEQPHPFSGVAWIKPIAVAGSSINESLPKPDGSDLAYVIYTSGSTGNPKGVAIEHGSITNLLRSFSRRPGFTKADTILGLTTTSFDISVLEMFLPLWTGGRLRLTADRASEDPDSLVSLLDDEAITVLQTTPSTLRVLLATGWKPSGNLTILSGGEPLMLDLSETLRNFCRELWNVYGPTETTVWSTIKEIEDASVSIGQPIDNTLTYVLDSQLTPVPVGVAGELCIGGAGVARGYRNREDLTSERFVTLPDIEDHSIRLYRTGDQVYQDRDGSLHFLARNDRQIKLRGFRIELDEIESVLQSHEDVQRSAVITIGDDQHRRIAAFCQACCHEDLLQEYLRLRLPEYMLPASIQVLDSIPQTAAGKTDYKSLPQLVRGLSSSKQVEPPETPLEVSIADMWAEVLQRDSVSRNDNFFRLGGNSLQAAQLFSRLRDRFNVQIPLRTLYDSPTVASIAECVVCEQLRQNDNLQLSLLDHLENLSDEQVRVALSESVEDNSDSQL